MDEIENNVEEQTTDQEESQFEESNDSYEEQEDDSSYDDSQDDSEEPNYRELYEQEKEAREKAESLIVKGKKKAKEKIEKAKTSKDNSGDSTLSERLDRSDLRGEGIREKEDQDYVIRFAKSEGIDVIEALSDPIVQDRIARNAKTRQERKAGVRPNNRVSNAGRDTLSADYARYKKDGTVPDNPMRASALLSKLADEA